MTTLIQNKYEIIGMFAPFTEQLPGHNCSNAPLLDEEKLKAFNNLMRNPNLPAKLKLEITGRFWDFICHYEAVYTDEELLAFRLEDISRCLKEWRKNPDERTHWSTLREMASRFKEPEVDI